MNIKFDGLTITDSQIVKIKKTSSDPIIGKLRKDIIKRKGLALISDNMIHIIIVRITLNKKLRVEQRKQLLSLEFNSLFSDLIKRTLLVTNSKLKISDFV